MRHLVSKYSVFFMNLIQDLENPSIRGMRGEMSPSLENTAKLLTTVISSPDLSSDDDLSGGATPTSSGEGTPTLPATPSSGSNPSSGSSTPTSSSSMSNIFEEGNRAEVVPRHQHIHKHHIHIRRQDSRTRSRMERASYKCMSFILFSIT